MHLTHQGTEDTEKEKSEMHFPSWLVFDWNKARILDCIQIFLNFSSLAPILQISEKQCIMHKSRMHKSLKNSFHLIFKATLWMKIINSIKAILVEKKKPECQRGKMTHWRSQPLSGRTRTQIHTFVIQTLWGWFYLFNICHQNKSTRKILKRECTSVISDCSYWSF